MHQLEALTAASLRELLEGGVSTAVVPFGSTEHQGEHLPVGADAVVAEAVGIRVARTLDALLLPTFCIGHAPAHGDRPGTITLRGTTLTDTAVDVGQSLARNGVRVIAFVAAHGGNAAPLEAAVTTLNGAFTDSVACAPKGDLGPHPGSHSGEWLTSVMLALAPELVHLAAASRELAPELAKASAERGAAHLKRFVGAIVAEMCDVAGVQPRPGDERNLPSASPCANPGTDRFG